MKDKHVSIPMTILSLAIGIIVMQRALVGFDIG